jgi:hypothetical protein
MTGGYRQPEYTVKALTQATDIICHYASQTRRYEQ